MKKANLGSSQIYSDNFKIFNSNISADNFEGKEVVPSSIIISAEQTAGADTGKYAIVMTDASKIATTVVKNYVEENDTKILIDDKLRNLTSSCSTLSGKIATMTGNIAVLSSKVATNNAKISNLQTAVQSNTTNITNLTATFNNTFNIVNNLQVDSLKENTKFIVGFPEQPENEKVTIQEAFNKIINGLNLMFDEFEELKNRVTNLENNQIPPHEHIA